MFHKKYTLLSAAHIILSGMVFLCSASVRIDNLHGNFFLIHKDSQDTVQISDTTYALAPGQTVVTADTSNMKLIFSNGTKMHLKPKTTIENTDSGIIFLRSGTILADCVTDSQNPFILFTPEVKIQVKGTRFAVKIISGLFSAFAVTKGAVVLNKTGDTSSVVLSAGQKIKKPFGKPFGNIQLLSKKEFASLSGDRDSMISMINMKKQTDSTADSSQISTDSTAAQVHKDSLSADTLSVNGTKADTTATDSTADKNKTVETETTPASGLKNKAGEKTSLQNGQKPDETPEQAEDKNKPEKENKKEGIRWEVGLGSVTIDGKQWQRITISPDIPLWKFGICLDFELFIDDSGNFSDKSWNFENTDQVMSSLSRKIRYIRFGHSGDPLFLKLGAIDNVTLGYGLIMSGFGNTFGYPEYKKLGLQFEVNGITAVNFGLQAVIQNLQDIKNESSVFGIRASIQPAAFTGIPILSRLETGVVVVADENQYKALRDTDGDGLPNIIDSAPNNSRVSARNVIVQADEPDTTTARKKQEALDEVNKIKANFRKVDKFAVGGFDAGLPLIQNGLLKVTIYGQYAMDIDFSDRDPDDPSKTEGWGIAAPGIMLKAGPFGGAIEFRHLANRFQPSYFNSTYERDRLRMIGTTAATKESTLDSVTMNGVFASLTTKLGPLATATAEYQYLTGDINTQKDEAEQELTAQTSLGKMIVKKVPKLESISAYFSKTRIGRDIIYDTLGNTRNDDFFEKSRYMMYGYKLGFELSKGIVLFWDKRTIYVYDEKKQLIPETKTYIQTTIRF